MKKDTIHFPLSSLTLNMTAIAPPQQTSSDSSIITLISTCHGLSHFYQLVAPSLYLFMAPELSLSYSELGLSLVVFSAVSAIGQPLSGILVDRIGGVTTLIVGTLIYASAIALIGMSQGLLTLIAAAALAGLGNCGYHPSDLSIINNKVSHGKLPLAYSFHVIGGQIGWALAPVSMVLLANVFDWRTALLLASLPGFILSAIVFICRKQLQYQIKPKAENIGVPKQSFISMFTIPWIWIMMLFFAMHSVATMPVPQFGQVIFFHLLHLSKELIATYASLFLLASALGTISGGLILGKKITSETVSMNNARQFASANRIAFICMSIAGVAYAAMAFVPASLLLPVLAVAGFCVGMTSPSRDSLVRIMTRGKNQGKAYGIVYSGLDLGMLFAPAVIGSLIDNQMVAATLMVPAIGCWLSVFIILMSKKDKNFQANEQPA